MTNTRKLGTARNSAFLYGAVGLVAAVLLLGAGSFLWLTGSRVGPSIGGSFTLENSAGKIVKASDFRGKYMLVYFGYTYCPDVCPTTLNTVAAALDQLGPRAKEVAPIFITIDPQRDTPQVMQRYTAAFSPQLIGLTGTADEIAQVAKEYHVYYAKHIIGPGPDDYSMDHSSIIYLMGPNEEFIAPISAKGSAQDMVEGISRAMS